MNSFSDRSGNAAGASPSLAKTCPDNYLEVVLPKNSNSPLAMSGGGASVALAMEAYKRLRTRLMSVQASRGIRSVAVTSAAQSDGKTVTSFNLACCCAQLEGLSVLLIDGDLRTRGLTRLIDKLPQFGLADVLNRSVQYERAIARTDLANLCVMGAGSSDTEAAELLSGDGWKRLIDWASNRFNLVLVDSLPVDSVADSDLIAAGCDGVLVVVRAHSTPRAALEQAFERIDPGKLIGVVWNAVTESSAHQIAYARRSPGPRPMEK